MSAIISDCGLYRYRLERDVATNEDHGVTAVIMVNPSTADATENDATIRKLRGFALENQWRRVIVGNLFAFRATDVRELRSAVDPVGPENDEHLSRIMGDADRVVLAWGPLAKQPPYWRHRWRVVYDIARSHHAHVFGLGSPVKDGHPRHPLMTPYSQGPRRWSPPA